MSVSHGKNRALKRFLRNKFRNTQKQIRSETQNGGSKAPALDKGPAYSLSTDIPPKYNDSFVRVIPRDPQHAFVYWEKPSQNAAGNNESAKKSEKETSVKHETIKIQHIPAFQNVKYPQTVLNFQADNSFNSENSIPINHHHENTIAQINPQSDVGSTYIQMPANGGRIKAQYGIESESGKSFGVMISSPEAVNSVPSVKLSANDKKSAGIDTEALIAFSSVKLTVGGKNISGLSSGNLYNTDTEKKS